MVGRLFLLVLFARSVMASEPFVPVSREVMCSEILKQSEALLTNGDRRTASLEVARILMTHFPGTPPQRGSHQEVEEVSFVSHFQMDPTGHTLEGVQIVHSNSEVEVLRARLWKTLMALNSNHPVHLEIIEDEEIKQGNEIQKIEKVRLFLKGLHGSLSLLKGPESKGSVAEAVLKDSKGLWHPVRKAGRFVKRLGYRILAASAAVIGVEAALVYSGTLSRLPDSVAFITLGTLFAGMASTFFGWTFETLALQENVLKIKSPFDFQWKVEHALRYNRLKDFCLYMSFDFENYVLDLIVAQPDRAFFIWRHRT